MFLAIYRLFESVEEKEGAQGIAIYDYYVQTCLGLQVPPQNARGFGGCVKHCFPAMKSASRRQAGDWATKAQTYFNLAYISPEVDADNLNAKEKISLGLPHSATLEENPTGFTVTLNSTILCDDEPLQYKIHISKALKVSLLVHDKDIPLVDYGIRDQLPLISSHYIRAMVKSVLSLKICLGEKQDVVNKKKHVSFQWSMLSGDVKKSLHSKICKIFLPIMSTVKKCIKCRKAFAKEIFEQECLSVVNDKIHIAQKQNNNPNPSEKIVPLPHIVPMQPTPLAYNQQPCPSTISPNKQDDFAISQPDLSTPTASKKPRVDYRSTPSPLSVKMFYEKKTTADAAVGTTPVKSAQQLLLKFFPYLQSRPQLVHLISEQVKTAQHSDARGRRYDKEILSLALTLWTRSPKSYNELIKAGFLFPSPNTLSLYKNCVHQKPGINPDMMQWMYNEAHRNNIPAVGGLLLDEMNIQKDLQISNKGGQWTMVGFPYLGEGSTAMTKMTKGKNNLDLADHVLQLLFHGLTGFRMPFACYPTTQANSCDLYLTVWDAVSSLQLWEFTVAYISLDGSSNNRAFVKMHFDNDPMDDKMLMRNRTVPSQKIAVIPDPSHVIKKIRNSIFNSGATPEYSRHLLIKGNHVDWQQWEDAFMWCQNRMINPVAPHPKLTREHIFLTEPGKMRNAWAIETLNDDMLYLMEAYQNSLNATEADSLAGAIELLQNTSIIIRNMTDKRAINDENDARLQENMSVLKWLIEWEKSAKSSTELMAAQCREDWKWMIMGFDSFVKMVIHKYKSSVFPCDINSDIIENFFCSQRAITGGSTTNPGMKNYLHNINSIVLGQSSISTKSNAGCSGKSAAPYKYSTPGPLQPKPPRRRVLFREPND